jgi:branched-chain amino acid transport system ATP-binding protein
MLEVHDLVVRYGALEALHGVSLAVSDGEFVAILGRNGAGKTTLVHAIAGVVKPHSGTVSYRGRRIDHRSPGAIVRGGIAVVPEGRQLFGGLSVADNLRLGAYGSVVAGPSGLIRALLPRHATVRARMERVLELLPELAELLGRPARALSGGQQQMVAVGRALMAEPSALIVDELSLGLAPLVVRRLLGHLATLHASGITILLIEQNIALALEAAERAYVIEGGLIHYSGTSSELADSPRVLSTYLGVEEAIAG